MTKLYLSYKRHRFPPEIITHAVWLYCRFNLSFREMEEMFLERGIDVSYETIRRWVAKFGPAIARELRRKQHQPGDIWYLDETLQDRRNTAAAKRLLSRLMKRHGRAPKRFITDKLRSYGAAKRKIAPSVEHRSHKGLNDRGLVTV